MNGKRFLVAGILMVLLAAGAFAAPFRIAVVMPSATNDMAFSQSMWSALVTIQKEMGGEKRLS